MMEHSKLKAERDGIELLNKGLTEDVARMKHRYEETDALLEK
jgi:hypothetical protein